MALPALSVLIPAVSGTALLFAEKWNRKKLRGMTLLSFVLSVICSVGTFFFGKEIRFPEFSGGLSLCFSPDGVSFFFAAAACLVFLMCCLFSFEYMKKEEKEASFYGFMLLSFSGFLGMSFSGNLFSSYVFFEMITLCSFPLVLHERTKEALFGGKKYLFYSIGGSLAALFGVFLLSFCGVSDFSAGAAVSASPLTVTGIFFCVVGFGAKAGMFPMQSWLPSAHPVAPAPASALLSGILTKAGIFMIVRILFFCGGSLIQGTWAQYWLLALALLTVLTGSVLALKEQDIKKRLAFSTVSQTSYILLGFLSFTPAGLIGGFLHVILHCLAKTALFLCAGAVIYQTDTRDVSLFDGLGKKMPVTMGAFTLASLALIGIPPTVGFSSKWYLASGALSGGLYGWGVAVPVILLISAVFTAGYLLPVSVRSFFAGATADAKEKRREASPLMTVPLGVLSILTLVAGLFSGVLSGWIAGCFGL